MYALTVDDLVRILGLLPVEDFPALRTIVLRQPTRKQRLLADVWGRLVYRTDLVETKGPAVILEAQPRDLSMEWSRSLTPDGAEEIERLRADGHLVTGDRRWRIQASFDATRATQLFRTLPHEIGHYVHYHREVERPAGDDVDAWCVLYDRYFSKPQREKEHFAHRYARDVAERLSAAGAIPYPRIVDEANMRRWRLDPAWFGLA